MNVIVNKIGSFDAKFSIVMPSFNQGKFISEAVESVLSQNCGNIELIILDGGSSDDTLKVLEKYHDKISYIQTGRDGGQAAALNCGIKLATGKYIGWLNSDDKYVKGAFGYVEDVFLNNLDVVLVHGDRILIDGDGLVYGWGAQGDFDPDKSGFNVCSETSFWRRSCVDAGIAFDDSLRFAMDLDFFCKIYKFGKFYKINEFLGYFRAHGESKSTNIWDVGLEEAEIVWRRHFGAGHDGWLKKDILREKWKKDLILRAIKNPKICLLPYISRRITRGRGV